MAFKSFTGNVINDSLLLDASIRPFDENFCKSIKLRIEPIVTFDGEHVCGLGDLYPPFKIYKPTISDTLSVIKDGKVILFKIPADLCD
jgi:hypothetical protein